MTRWLGGSSRLRRTLAMICGGLLALLVIAVPLDLNRQLMFAPGIILATLIIDRWKTRQATVFICVLTLVVSTRYIFWRATYTLFFTSPLSALFGSVLFLAELYAWVILCLGLLQTAWPMHRQVVPIEGDDSQWPAIDVFIPTYNEKLSVVRNTVFAAMAMDYPKSRFRVFLLDDGRRPEFQTFARLAGCGYLTRQDNKHAKAGNLNAAMKRTDGELICIFDCDHVPTRAFLQMTVGWFQRDPKLAMLQTPHHFYSPDPVQRNLGLERDLPGEGELFYGAVQGGNDLWNATFFCGSCALIRRKALADTRGFAGETVTEDAHTALKLQRLGWNTAYINIRLAAGLATERLALHIGQRSRWARGMTQIMRIDNPLFGPGLNLSQRLCYLNAMLHFQFPLPRLVFLLSPLAYLLGGQSVIRASAALIFAYAAPHLVCTMRTNARLQGSERRPFWGEIYETLLAFHLVKPTILTLVDPSKGKFNVTAKGGLVEHEFFDWRISAPYLVLVLLNVVGALLAIPRMIWWNSFEADTVAINLIWTLFNLTLLGAVLGVAAETRQIRTAPRVPKRMPATLHLGAGAAPIGCSTVDFSMHGLGVETHEPLAVTRGQLLEVSLQYDTLECVFPCEVAVVKGEHIGLLLKDLSIEQERDYVRCTFGSPDAWSDWDREVGVDHPLESFAEVFSFGATGYLRLFQSLYNRL